MEYVLEIPQKNVRAHLDIEKDIQTQKNGIFTCNLRINRGTIEDYSKFETVTLAAWQSIISIAITQCFITFDPLQGNSQNEVRNGNGERSAQGRESAIGNATDNSKQANPL